MEENARFRYTFWDFLAEPFREGRSCTLASRIRILLSAFFLVDITNWVTGRRRDDWMAIPAYGFVFLIWYLIVRHYKLTDWKNAAEQSLSANSS